MTPLLRLSATALVCVAISPLAYAQRLTADEKELASYRLTLPIVKKLSAVMLAFAAEHAKDPKVQELQSIEKQIEALENKDELTEAEEARLEKLRERAEALEADVQGTLPELDDPKSLDEIERGLKAHPVAGRILAREGMPPREFALALMTLLQASLVEAFSQGQADPSKLPPGVNPENVKFVREHKAELEAIRASMEAAAGKK